MVISWVEKEKDGSHLNRDNKCHQVVQGVQEKLCFFTIQYNPSLAYIAVRDLQSSQRSVSVQSLLLAGNFLNNQSQPSAGEGEEANFREFLGKNTIFNEHPVCMLLKIVYRKFINFSANHSFKFGYLVYALN